MQTRRDFGKMLTGIAAVAAMDPAKMFAQHKKVETTVAGVKLGLITGSIVGRPPMPPGGGTPPAPEPLTVDEVIARCLDVPAANIEYSGPAVDMPRLIDGVIGQPPNVLTDAYRKSRAQVREWHMDAPLAPFQEARRKFDAAGLNWFSGVNTIAADCDDEEIGAIFKQMDAMGVRLFCTNQTRVSMAQRMIPFAKKYNIRPAWHTHDKSDDPDEIGSAESVVKVMKMSPLFAVNLDIGHFTAGNQDAVAFIKEHHDWITHIHVKDRKKDHGPNVAWGTGDTPIVECLHVIRDNHYPIYAIIEREYHGPNDGTPVEETRKDMDYMKKALQS